MSGDNSLIFILKVISMPATQAQWLILASHLLHSPPLPPLPYCTHRCPILTVVRRVSAITPFSLHNIHISPLTTTSITLCLQQLIVLHLPHPLTLNCTFQYWISTVLPRQDWELFLVHREIFLIVPLWMKPWSWVLHIMMPSLQTLYMERRHQKTPLMVFHSIQQWVVKACSTHMV